MGAEHRVWSPLCGRNACTTPRSWNHSHERHTTSRSGHVCGRGRLSYCCRCSYHASGNPRHGTLRYRRYPRCHLPHVDANGLWFGPSMDCNIDCSDHVFPHDHGTSSGCRHSRSRIHDGRNGPRFTFIPRSDSFSRDWSILGNAPGALHLRIGSRLHASQNSLSQRIYTPPSRSAPSQQTSRGPSDDARKIGWTVWPCATQTARSQDSSVLARSIAPSSPRTRTQRNSRPAQFFTGTLTPFSFASCCCEDPPRCSAQTKLSSPHCYGFSCL